MQWKIVQNGHMMLILHTAAIEICIYTVSQSSQFSGVVVSVRRLQIIVIPQNFGDGFRVAKNLEPSLYGTKF